MRNIPFPTGAMTRFARNPLFHFINRHVFVFMQRSMTAQASCVSRYVYSENSPYLIAKLALKSFVCFGVFVLLIPCIELSQLDVVLCQAP